MRVLVACEFSGVVREAFTKLGHDAWSCDLLPTEIPGKHYEGCITDIIDNDWDLMIAHPPCTFLTGAAEWAFSSKPMINGKPRKMKPGTLIGKKRKKARRDALDFIDFLWNAPIEKICIENPVGIITRERPGMGKPQYVQQYWFGEDASKKTGLWLKNLPKLQKTHEVLPRIVDGKKRWANQTDSGQNKLAPSEDRGKLRSITPTGLARAMAAQWGSLES